jgi:hypothetical protein
MCLVRPSFKLTGLVPEPALHVSDRTAQRATRVVWHLRPGKTTLGEVIQGRDLLLLKFIAKSLIRSLLN